MPGPFDAVTIAGNEIDATATADESSNGVAVIGKVATLVLGNNSVRNTTAHGFDLRNIVGTATLTGNRISTGEIGRPGGPGFYVDGIRCAGSGSYTVEHNSVDTGFGNAAAIRLAGTLGALVHANAVNMLVPDGTPIGAQSAGIVVQGSARDNVVRNNRIRGHALVALSVIHSDFPLDKGSGSGNPSDTLLLGNEFETFDATFVDIEIGPGAVNTRIVGGSGSIDDQGTGTTVTAEYDRVELSLHKLHPRRHDRSGRVRSDAGGRRRVPPRRSAPWRATGQAANGLSFSSETRAATDASTRTYWCSGAAQATLVPDDHVVETLATEGADHPFDEGILQGGISRSRARKRCSASAPETLSDGSPNPLYCLTTPRRDHFWHYDFRVNGRRYQASTETADKHQARDIEARAVTDSGRAARHPAPAGHWFPRVREDVRSGPSGAGQEEQPTRRGDHQDAQSLLRAGHRSREYGPPLVR